MSSCANPTNNLEVIDMQYRGVFRSSIPRWYLEFTETEMILMNDYRTVKRSRAFTVGSQVFTLNFSGGHVYGGTFYNVDTFFHVADVKYYRIDT